MKTKEKINKVFSGTLFLVVGNSGSGKDSIIKAVLERYPSDLKSIRLTQRYITRPPSETEDNISMNPGEFREMSKQGKFALEWHIYDLDYGVPIEIDSWLKNGHPVLVNVSRTIVKEACEIYRNLKIIFIEVPFEITLKRLKTRARESGKRLEERIERAKKNQKFPDADFIVDNSEKLENAINQFLNYLVSVVRGKEIF
ncbi:Ribose 1,5-bisphosphate phosphokinase PhnN [subsurface metagenome]